MYFVTIRAAPGRLLWRTIEEGNRFLECARSHLVDLLAWVFLLDHVHLGFRSRQGLHRVTVFMRAWTLARNRLRGETGPAWSHRDLAWREETGRAGQRILLRYCSLNPCRKGHAYVNSPLAWPWGGHRDLVGLSLDPLVRPVRDPEAYHRFVTSDPVFQRYGARALPTAAPRQEQEPTPGEVIAAVAALLRRAPGDLRRRGPARRALVAAFRAVTDLGQRQIAARLGVHHATVGRTPPLAPDAADVVRRVAGDPRFSPWTDGDLARLARRFHPDRR